MRHIALLMLLIGFAATTARADVSVEKWQVWYGSPKTPDVRDEFTDFFVPTSDGTHKFTSVIKQSSDPNDKLTADVTVTRHGDILNIRWEAHSSRSGKSWPVAPSHPVTITSDSKFEGHLTGGDDIHGQKE
jgi:hypothetical protein